MSHQVDALVVLASHDLVNLGCNVGGLPLNQHFGKSSRLAFEIEKVGVNARVAISVLVHFRDVLKQAVRNRLKLVDAAFVAHDEEVDELFDWLGPLFVALARAVDVVYGVRVGVQRILILLRAHVDVLQQACPVNDVCLLHGYPVHCDEDKS